MRCLCSECKLCTKNDKDTYDCNSTIYPRANMTVQQINAWRICYSFEFKRSDIIK